MARLSPPLPCRATRAVVRTTAEEDDGVIEETAAVVGLTATTEDESATLVGLTTAEETELTRTTVDEDEDAGLRTVPDELLTPDVEPILELPLDDPLSEGMI
jgi:hypothetical protein